jgi:hypothetical protein
LLTLKEKHVAEDLKRIYIQAIISVVEEDKRSVLLYVAFDLAVVSLTLSEKILQSTTAKSPYVAAGLCLLLASAGLFFNYYRKVHLSTFAIADQLLSLDTAKARSIPAATWEQHKLCYLIGFFVRLFGLSVLIVAYLKPQ